MQLDQQMQQSCARDDTYRNKKINVRYTQNIYVHKYTVGTSCSFDGCKCARAPGEIIRAAESLQSLYVKAKAYLVFFDVGDFYHIILWL
jgi:hypothetical protein